MFKRLRQVLSANANAVMDKIEDPEKMVDQYIRDTETALGDVKGKTADAMVIEKRCHSRVAECKNNIAELEAYAKQALEKGNEEDLAKFIERKLAFEDQLVSLEKAAEASTANAEKMKELHGQLSERLCDYRNKRDLIKSQMAVVKTGKKMADINGIAAGINGISGDFERMEGRVNDMLAKQEALAELDVTELSDLKSKYSVSEKNGRVAAAVAQFKEKAALAG